MLTFERNLVDLDNKGQLYYPEFALAVYYCKLRRSGLSIPLSLPRDIGQEVRNHVDYIYFCLPKITYMGLEGDNWPFDS